MSRIRKKSSSGKWIIIVIFLGIVLGGGYIYTSPEFERVAPQITSQNNFYWNKKAPFQIKLTDNVGLKSFTLVLSDGKTSVIVGQGEFEKGITERLLSIKYPKSKLLDPKAKHLKLKITVVDQSLWNTFQGNQSEKIIDIQVDTKMPTINILANSYSITQGGSALVVFYAADENLDKLYVEAAGNHFKVEPYKQDGYYATLVAWPFNQDEFEADVVAIDQAGNQRKTRIPFYLKTFSYKVSWIQAKDSFIDGKITDLASVDSDYEEVSERLDKLKAVNETMRLKNEEKIHKLSKVVSDEMLDKWKIEKFYPLKNGAKVASYGDERHYYYKDQHNEVSHSYHVGYDLASTKMAIIRSSNPGRVVFAGFNGIYGNMPMIDHGFGLYTLYGHCSQLLVEEGDYVKKDQAIAKTGVSGLALGDHLHFGILVQGIEVRPVEWFDAAWIKKNIDNIFAEADKIIDKK
ncbi:M23 family metallopeptidase [Sulfurovum sp. zt1-1]|uniref:M23 family metallopeptidase n=1 Tax=Sulfurovum zhangzhouensis TaxID=3019067 RepID=A0ABT7QWZ1_9BACT|nr:M23 family metallopeptidase [Sulfurovum zhangzhouensis]MDM5271297.1 M23 family metallopeptidase [Sulfurovum zhangzhouensis]